MKLMVYSHDAFGLGNIRRMLAICEGLLEQIEDLSILILSGSPMLQSFRLPPRLDYIKLPCINRGETGQLRAKDLGTSLQETLQLRSDLMRSVAANFQPDVLLVDKKPYGIEGELTETIRHLKSELPETKLVLLLRDILDRAEVTIADWEKHDYYNAIAQFYDRVLVVGMPQIFDVTREYQFPAAVNRKVRFCGYMRRPEGHQAVADIRQALGILPTEQLILVTPGGGEDGYQLISTYLQGLRLLPSQNTLKTLIFTGPEMPASQRMAIAEQVASLPQVMVREFSDDLMSYIAAADAVVAMGGYNTICEILTADRPAVIVPRIKPSQEQLIRASRMQQLGLFKAIHPEQLSPTKLMRSVLYQLQQDHLRPSLSLDLGALPRIGKHILRLSQSPQLITASDAKIAYLVQKQEPNPCLPHSVQRKSQSTSQPKPTNLAIAQ
ncbi:MAG: glycosyltransferase [Synechococcales bacterium]|nr:glycosyltransferase [Synechococcales bacterium]